MYGVVFSCVILSLPRSRTALPSFERRAQPSLLVLQVKFVKSSEVKQNHDEVIWLFGRVISWRQLIWIPFGHSESGETQLRNQK